MTSDETPKVEKRALCLERPAVLRVVDALRLYRQAAERVMNQTGVWGAALDNFKQEVEEIEKKLGGDA